MAQFTFTDDDGNTFTAETQRDLKKQINAAAKVTAERERVQREQYAKAEARANSNAVTFYSHKATGDRQGAIKVSADEKIYNVRIRYDQDMQRTVITLRSVADDGKNVDADIKIWGSVTLTHILKTFSVVRGYVVRDRAGDEQVFAVGHFEQEATHTEVYGFTSEDWETHAEREGREEDARRFEEMSLAAKTA